MKYFSIASVCFLLLASCSGGNDGREYERTVRVMQPTSQADVRERNFAGIVKEAHKISLGFKTAGQINHIYVKDGDHVKKGTLMATLDNSDYLLNVEGLRAQVSQMKSEYERCRKLYEQKSMSLNDYEKVKSAYAQLDARLKSVENQLSYTRLYAPVNGIVQSVNFSASEMVDAGTPVFNLIDDSGMEVEIDIPSSLYRNRDKISEFQGIMPGSDNTVPLRLLSIVPKADGNQLYRVKLSVPSSFRRELTPGMNIEVKVKMSEGVALAPSILIPAHSIVRRNDSTFVWIVGPDSTVVKRPVVVDVIDNEGRVVVSDGLNGSETVVRSGVNMLLEGEKVKILAEPAKTNVGGLL
ncbi:MAG: efflux RND transporter periplasmic adaptor subunit [Muribaculum sp.]|nr:efflux RND transporter periplasmic adaptor subunit [Muribaculum sp.]